MGYAASLLDFWWRGDCLVKWPRRELWRTFVGDQEYDRNLAGPDRRTSSSDWKFEHFTLPLSIETQKRK